MGGHPGVNRRVSTMMSKVNLAATRLCSCSMTAAVSSQLQ